MPDPDYIDLGNVATIAHPIFAMFGWEWMGLTPFYDDIFTDIEEKIRKMIGTEETGVTSGRIVVMKNEDAFDVLLDLGTVRMVQE